jgi:VanZ family protein
MPYKPHRYSAWFLAAAYAGLVIYASLHPFAGWVALSNLSPLMVWLPWPHYWGSFDIVANVLGYIPLGILLMLIIRHSDRGRWKKLLIVVAAAAFLSWGLEVTQYFLPSRVPSRLDWMLNVTGAAVGASSIELLAALGWLQRAAVFYDRWWREDESGGGALLLLWPFALSVPASVPFALGQFFDRFSKALRDWTEGSSLEKWFMGSSEILGFSLAPATEVLITALGLLAPCLIIFTVIRAPKARLGLAVLIVVSGVAATALATALKFGPHHAMTWVTQQTESALIVGTLLILGLAWWTPRVVAVLGLVCMTLSLQLVNTMPIDPYVTSSWLEWEQGRFIRFHGVARWIGWLWPMAVAGYLLRVALRAAR